MGTYPHFQWELSPLQAQIDAATDGDVIVVQPGLYQGRLYFSGKNITLTSTDPTNPDIVANTVLQVVNGSVVTFDGTETEACVLNGFTITGGATGGRGGGINGNSCQAGIFNCIIRNNSAAYGGGLAECIGNIEKCIIFNNSATMNGGGLVGCNGIISNSLIYNNSAIYGAGLNNCDGGVINCTISDNTAGIDGGGLRRSDGTITNSIIWGNSPDQLSGGSLPTYSCYPGDDEQGNISDDPMFIDRASQNYHLLPDSPCIDSGNPASDCSNEPWPNGDRINIGVYGNTPEATRSKDGLIPLGFEIINKTRIGRTVFEYELAVILHNTNEYVMSDVQLRLVDMDQAVISVSDDQIIMTSIAPDEIQTSQDIFSLMIDRSESIATGRLTWELSYYVQGQAQPPSLLTMPLSSIDSVPGDITGEGEVNLLDFAILSQQWYDVPGEPSADIALPLDNYVGIEDLLYLAENWLVVVSQ